VLPPAAQDDFLAEGGDDDAEPPSPKERDRRRGGAKSAKSAKTAKAAKTAAKAPPKVAAAAPAPAAAAPAPASAAPAPAPKTEVAQVDVAPKAQAAQPAPVVARAPAPPPVSSSSSLPPLDEKMIADTVARHKPAFDACVAAARQSESTLALDGRRVIVTVTVNPSGKAAYPTLDDAEIGATELGRCLKRETAQMTFPEFGGEPVRARVPLTLRW
jgi:hypothetical protein